MSLSSLNDFEIGKTLGKGAFGMVCLVKRKFDGKTYAMKRIKIVQLSEKDKENALNEIRILASLSHKNIIGYKDAFFDQKSKTLNIVMEFADDGDMSTKIKYNLKNKLHFKENTIWKYLIQILEGLNYLHDKKIIHRDLKSANIFLMKDKTIKIGDLNVSKYNKLGMAYTQTGTPYYASPEIWLDQPYDYKSDIWSLGCILYELCQLKPPFRGTSLKNLCINIQKGAYNPIPNYYSDDMKKIIGMMLKKDPNLRPTTTQILECDIIVKKINELKIRYKYENSMEEKQGLIATIKIPRNLGEINKNLPMNKYNNNKQQVREEMLMEDEYETTKRKNGFLDENDKKQIKDMFENGNNWDNNIKENMHNNNNYYNINNNYDININNINYRNNSHENNNDNINYNQNNNYNYYNNNNNIINNIRYNNNGNIISCDKKNNIFINIPNNIQQNYNINYEEEMSHKNNYINNNISYKQNILYNDNYYINSNANKIPIINNNLINNSHNNYNINYNNINNNPIESYKYSNINKTDNYQFDHHKNNHNNNSKNIKKNYKNSSSTNKSIKTNPNTKINKVNQSKTPSNISKINLNRNPNIKKENERPFTVNSNRKNYNNNNKPTKAINQGKNYRDSNVEKENYNYLNNNKYKVEKRNEIIKNNNQKRKRAVSSNNKRIIIKNNNNYDNIKKNNNNGYAKKYRNHYDSNIEINKVNKNKVNKKNSFIQQKMNNNKYNMKYNNRAVTPNPQQIKKNDIGVKKYKNNIEIKKRNNSNVIIEKYNYQPKKKIQNEINKYNNINNNNNNQNAVQKRNSVNFIKTKNKVSNNMNIYQSNPGKKSANKSYVYNYRNYVKNASHLY